MPYKDPEAKKRRQKERYAADAERIKARQRAYNAEHRDEQAAYRAAYYAKHRDEVIARVADYAKRNPHVSAAKNMRRRAAKLNTAVEDSAAMTEFIKNCPAGYHVDHIVPLSKGGTHTLDNLQYLCAKLNTQKGAKMPGDWNDPRPIRCRP